LSTLRACATEKHKERLTAAVEKKKFVSKANFAPDPEKSNSAASFAGTSQGLKKIIEERSKA